MKVTVRNLTFIESVYVIFSRICVAVCAVLKDLGTFILTLKLLSLDKGLPIKKKTIIIHRGNTSSYFSLNLPVYFVGKQVNSAQEALPSPP